MSRSFPKGSEVGSLRWTNTVSFMFNNFLSNRAIIYVARNKENVVVAKNLNLAVTDFGVELIIQPSGHNKILMSAIYSFFIVLLTFCIAWVFWL